MAFNRLENLTFIQVDELNNDKTIAVIPTGSMEQHGPHLPIGMDTQTAVLVAEATLTEVDEKVDCLLLPAVAVEQSPEHMDFSGTLTYSAETYIKNFERDLFEFGASWV